MKDRYLSIFRLKVLNWKSLKKEKKSENIFLPIQKKIENRKSLQVLIFFGQKNRRLRLRLSRY